MLRDLKRSLQAATGAQNSRNASPAAGRLTRPETVISHRTPRLRKPYRRTCVSVIRRPSSPPLDPDLQELEAKGLLNFTIEEPPPPTRYIRGSRRISFTTRDFQGKSRANSRIIVSLQTSVNSSPRNDWKPSGNEEKIPQTQSEDVEIKWENASLASDNEDEPIYQTEIVKKPSQIAAKIPQIDRKETEIKRIQAVWRGVLARKRVKIPRNRLIERVILRNDSGKYVFCALTETKDRYFQVTGTEMGAFKPFLARKIRKNTEISPLNLIKILLFQQPAAFSSISRLIEYRTMRFYLQKLSEKVSKRKKAAQNVRWKLIKAVESEENSKEIEKFLCESSVSRDLPLTSPFHSPCKPSNLPFFPAEDPAISQFDKQTTLTSDSSASNTKISTKTTANSLKNASFLTNSAVKIQKIVRKWLKRRLWKYIWNKKEKKLLYRGFHVLNSVSISFISLYKIEGNIEIRSENPDSKLTLAGPELAQFHLKKGNFYRELVNLLSISDGKLQVFKCFSADFTRYVLIVQRHIRGFLARRLYRSLKVKTRRRLVLVRSKVWKGERFFISLYQTEDSIRIEAFKLYETLTIKYRQRVVTYVTREVEEMYGYLPGFDVICDDIELTPDSLVLHARSRLLTPRSLDPLSPRPPLDKRDRSPRPDEQRSLLRTSLRMEGKLWVIMVSIDRDTMEFKALSGGRQSPLSVTCLVKRLKEKVGLSDLIPISMVAIHHMLSIQDTQLVLDFGAVVPNTNRLITLIQAYIRGFMVRRRLGPIPKGKLMACKLITDHDEEWALYAYREPKTVRIEAAKRGSSEKLEMCISSAIFLRFPPSLSNKRVVENFIFPKLSLENMEDDRPQLNLSNSSQLSGLLDKHKDKIKVISSSPRRKIECNDQEMQLLIDPGDETVPVNPGFGSKTHLLPIAYQSSPLVQGNRGESHGKGVYELVLNTSVERNGRQYQATVYKGEQGGYRVTLVDRQRGEVVEVTGTEECGTVAEAQDIVDRLEIGSEGVMVNPGKVVYKREHYISSRYFCVTIYVKTQFVCVEAFDPIRKVTLNIQLPRESVEITEQALSATVARLRLQSQDHTPKLVFV